MRVAAQQSSDLRILENMRKAAESLSSSIYENLILVESTFGKGYFAKAFTESASECSCLTLGMNIRYLMSTTTSSRESENL